MISPPINMATFAVLSICQRTSRPFPRVRSFSLPSGLLPFSWSFCQTVNIKCNRIYFSQQWTICNTQIHESQLRRCTLLTEGRFLIRLLQKLRGFRYRNTVQSHTSKIKISDTLRKWRITEIATIKAARKDVRQNHLKRNSPFTHVNGIVYL